MVVVSRHNKQCTILVKVRVPAVTSSSDRLLNRRNCIIWTFSAKGTYLGRVDEPTIAKFAPFENVDPIDSKYGLRKLVFTFWPAVKIILVSQIHKLWCIYQLRIYRGPMHNVSTVKLSRKKQAHMWSQVSTIHVKITLNNKTRPTHYIKKKFSIVCWL